MKNRLISFLTIIAILFTVIPFRAEAVEEGVTLHPISAKTPGDSVTISGETNLDEVSIKVIRPNNTILYVDVVEAGNGSYSNTFTLPADAATGTYKAVAGQGNIVASGTFSVSSSNGGGHVGLNPISNKLPGDSVTVSGETNLDEISIKVIHPNNTILFVDVAQVSNGIYTKTFNLPEDAATGTYTLVVGQGETVTTKTFEVKEGLSNNANLSNLTLSERELTPAFSPGTTGYTVIVDNKVESITVTPVTEDENATVKVNDKEVAYFQASETISLEVGRNRVSVLVIAEDGTTKEYTVTLTRRYKLNKDKERLILDEKTKHLEIPPDRNKPLELEIPPDVKNTSVKFSTEPTPTGKKAILPKLAVKANRLVGGIERRLQLDIPAGTKVTGPVDWDGTLKLPEIVNNDQVNGVDGDVSAVVKVGFGDKELVFDKAVRLLIPGQAGKAAGYVRGGSFTPIKYTLTSDSQTAANAELTGAIKDGKVDAGDDLTIWTKHFTKFVSYTPEEKQTKPSSGGGGGGAASSGDLITVRGGTVSKYNTSVSIPEDAVDSSIRVKIKKITGTTEIPLADNCMFISNVVEITKDEDGKFNKPVTVTMTFDSSDVDTEKYNLSIYWLNEESDNWTELDNVKVDLVTGEVKGKTDHFTKFAVIATAKASENPKIVLTDITGHWAKSAITEMVRRGVIGGYPDGTFKPNNNITRAEFAVFLVRAFNLELQQEKVFTDTAGHWAEKDIATAEYHEIVSGYDLDHFGPNDMITREQMASMAVRAKNLSVVSKRLTFADTEDISDWAEGAVATAVKYGIVNGYPDNTVRPKKNATRAEAIAVIFNAIK